MNFEFYIFKKTSTDYFQYYDDSTKDIFKNIEITADEQLSIYHYEDLVYYIYTRRLSDGYIGTSFVFNGVLYTDFVQIISICRDIYSLQKLSNNSTRDEYINKYTDIIASRLNSQKFLQCGKPTYNLNSENKVNHQYFDFNGLVDDDQEKITAISNAIKQYQWVYMNNNKKQHKVEVIKKDNTSTNSIFFIVSAIILSIAIDIYVLNLNQSTYSETTFSNTTNSETEVVIEEQDNIELPNSAFEADETKNTNNHNQNSSSSKKTIDYSSEDYW